MSQAWGAGNVLSPGAASYIAKNALVEPAPFTFGNAARSAPYGLMSPTLWNVDLTVRKDVSIREAIRFQFSADFFNVFNNVIFAAPVTTFDSANFGQLITTANAPRKIQFGTRFNF